MTTIADRIVAKLDEIGKPSSRASIEAGLSDSAIRDIVSGKSKSPTIATLEALCGPLDCSLGYLVGIDEPKVAKNPGPISKYWMVHGIGQRSPSYQHWSAPAAAMEAQRLAMANPGITFTVLETIEAFKAERPTIHTLGVTETDDIPF